MMLVPCPWCGPRNVSEFRFGGAGGPRPDPSTASPQQWRQYLYGQRNVLGWTREGWYHRAGCRRYITVERHTGTNEVRRVEDA